MNIRRGAEYAAIGAGLLLSGCAAGPFIPPEPTPKAAPENGEPTFLKPNQLSTYRDFVNNFRVSQYPGHTQILIEGITQYLDYPTVKEVHTGLITVRAICGIIEASIRTYDNRSGLRGALAETPTNDCPREIRVRLSHAN